MVFLVNLQPNCECRATPNRAYPDEESLVVVVEDATSFRPVVTGVGVLQVAIALLEEEVVRNELVLRLLGHA